jgi:hypothetical protein
MVALATKVYPWYIIPVFRIREGFDTDPRIQITGLRIRILLFSSVTQDANQK